MRDFFSKRTLRFAPRLVKPPFGGVRLRSQTHTFHALRAREQIPQPKSRARDNFKGPLPTLNLCGSAHSLVHIFVKRGQIIKFASKFNKMSLNLLKFLEIQQNADIFENRKCFFLFEGICAYMLHMCIYVAYAHICCICAYYVAYVHICAPCFQVGLNHSL